MKVPRGRASGRVAAYSQALNVLEQMTRERVVEDPQVVRRRLQRSRLRVPVELRVPTPRLGA